MGPEDEGTPPAEQAAFLSEEVSSFAPDVLNRESQRRGWPRAVPKPYQPSSLSRRAWKNVLQAKAPISPEAVDVVQLLEENWFWRSSTASPSLAGAPPAPRAATTRSDVAEHRYRQNLLTGGRGEPQNSREAEALDGETTLTTTQGRFDASGADSAELSRSSSANEAVRPRRSQSANVDDCLPPEDELDTRARSFDPNERRKGGLADTDPTLGDPLGTWAHRVFRFGPERKTTAPTHIPGTPEVADPPPRAKYEAQKSISEECDEAAVEAAWRWRFNRRWRTEQAKQLDPEYGLDGDDEDGWDTALGYLDACGPGYHLQVARTTSIDRNTLAASSLISEGSDGGNFFMDDSQREKSTLKEQADLDATKSIVSVARKARDLYRKQQKIERDVQERWGIAKVRMSWAGQFLSSVDIDSYGRFSFILAKVVDKTTAHRILVRGKHGSDKAGLMQALTNEVQETCKKYALMPVSVALVGSGVMEWSRERDHRINISSGRVEKGGDPKISSGDDVVRLAGALTRASLSAPNRVTVNGEKLS